RERESERERATEKDRERERIVPFAFGSCVALSPSACAFFVLSRSNCTLPQLLGCVLHRSSLVPYPSFLHSLSHFSLFSLSLRVSLSLSSSLSLVRIVEIQSLNDGIFLR